MNIKPITSYSGMSLRAACNDNMYQRKANKLGGFNEYVKWELLTPEVNGFSVELSHVRGTETTVMLTGKIPNKPGNTNLNIKIRASVNVLYGQVLKEPITQEVTVSSTISYNYAR